MGTEWSCKGCESKKRCGFGSETYAIRAGADSLIRLITATFSDTMTSACLETSYDAFKPYSAFAGGLVFGSGWWIFGDALAYRLAITHLPFSLLFLLPGLVATVGVWQNTPHSVHALRMAEERSPKCMHGSQAMHACMVAAKSMHAWLRHGMRESHVADMTDMAPHGPHAWPSCMVLYMAAPLHSWLPSPLSLPSSSCVAAAWLEGESGQT